MKGYCIIYNRRWVPKQCEIIEEKEGESLIEYFYRGKPTKIWTSNKNVFLTYEAARNFCYYYK